MFLQETPTISHKIIRRKLNLVSQQLRSPELFEEQEYIIDFKEAFDKQYEEEDHVINIMNSVFKYEA